jgi:hypothetical protein
MKLNRLDPSRRRPSTNRPTLQMEAVQHEAEGAVKTKRHTALFRVIFHLKIVRRESAITCFAKHAGRQGVMAMTVHSSSPSPGHFFAFQDSVTLYVFVCKFHEAKAAAEAKVTAEANAAAETEAADRITEFAAF